MVRKVVKKKKVVSKKKTPKKKAVKRIVRKVPSIAEGDTQLGKVLIENFVGLQKVMVNLSIKFDDLSNKIAKLLELFEISAKALAEKDLTIQQTARDDTKIMKEMGNLSNQNKVIARGLTLMNDRLSGEPEELMEKPPQIMERQPQIMERQPQIMERQPQMPFAAPPRNLPMQQPVKKPIAQPEKKATPSVTPNKSPVEGYQKSIASEPTLKKLPT